MIRVRKVEIPEPVKITTRHCARCGAPFHGKSGEAPPDGGKALTFAEWLIEAMDSYAPNGAGRAHRKRHRELVDKLEAMTDDAMALLLTQEDHEWVKAATEAFQMNPAVARLVVPYDSAIVTAELVDVEEKRP